MTIQVVSTTEAQAQPQASQKEASGSSQVEGVETKQSAPEGENSSEQNESAESDPVETEGSEDAADESGDSDSDEKENEAQDSEKDKPKKKGGFQRRIDKLNARNAAAQQELEYWKQMALKQSAGSEPKKESTPVEKPEKNVTDGRPDPENFETHTEYVEALTDWKLEQREKLTREKAEKSRLESEYQTVLKSHTERVQSFAKKTEDFQEVIEGVDDLPLSPTVENLIVSSENGPELMYELAKNRAEFERINRLPPLAAARELGKIEFKIGHSKDTPSEAKPETKKITNAPKPLEPVGSRGAPVEKSIYDVSLSQKDYERLRSKKRTG